MTQITAAYWLRVQRLVDNLQPEVQRSVLSAFEAIRQGMDERQLTEFMQRGGIDRFMQDILPDKDLDKALARVSARVQSVTRTAAEREVARVPGDVQTAFNVLNPKVVDAIKDLDTKVMSTLKENTRETVRDVVEQGLKDGKAPKAIAREIRDSVGLAPNQSKAVRNFERMLREKDATALTRALRDKRFDSTIAKAFAGGGLKESQVTAMVDQYRKRFVAFHAETVARTATLDATKLGQRLSWEGAIKEGYVDGKNLMKTWVGVKDDREREEHLEMEGETVPFNDTFSNGQMVPGDDEYNCRCVALYTAEENLLVKQPNETPEAFGDRAQGVIGTIRGVLETAEGGSIAEITEQLTGFFPEKPATGLLSTVKTQVSRLAKSTGKEIISTMISGRGRVYRFSGNVAVPVVPRPKLPPVVTTMPTVPGAQQLPPVPRLRVDEVALPPSWTKHEGAQVVWRQLLPEEQRFFRDHSFEFAIKAKRGNYGTYFPGGFRYGDKPKITVNPLLGRSLKKAPDPTIPKDRNLQTTVQRIESQDRIQAMSTLGHETGHAMDNMWGMADRSVFSNTMGTHYWSTGNSQSAIAFRAAMDEALQAARLNKNPAWGSALRDLKSYDDFIKSAYGRKKGYSLYDSQVKELVADIVTALRFNNPVRGGRWSAEQFKAMFPKAWDIVAKQLKQAP